MTTRPEPAGTDLDWQAFRYVTGEMSAEESIAFETRLAADQQAREAVAGAVELIQLTLSVPAEPGRLERRTPAPSVAPAPLHTRRLWLNVGISLAVATALLVATRIPWTRPPAGGEFPGELANVWSQTRLSDESGPPSDSGQSEHETEAEAWLAGDDDDRALPPTPTWLTAAMIGLSELDSDSVPPSERPSTKDL